MSNIRRFVMEKAVRVIAIGACGFSAFALGASMMNVRDNIIALAGALVLIGGSIIAINLIWKTLATKEETK